MIKRFAWLWGALLGAVLLPFLMLVSCAIVARLIFPFRLSISLEMLFYQIKTDGLWGAGLGLCGTLLWTGHRSLYWRLPSLLMGAGIALHYLWYIWLQWHGNSVLNTPSFTNRLHWVYTATHAPLLVAALALIFFALLLRPRPAASNQT